MENFVITIGRCFGSGGRALGKILSQKLGVPFYDKELLLDAAKKAGMSADFFERNDERVPQFLSGIIPFSFGMNPMPWYVGTSSISDDSLYKVQSEFINDLASSQSCIIVGRSADYVLRAHPGLISVFITAPLDACVNRIIERHECAGRQEAEQMAVRVNRLRANYYNFYTDKTWGDAASYDMCLDSSKLALEEIADIIIAYLNKRMAK
ncbi:MAG: AAA family ATPase [Muribaculaceae bacterium]